MKIIYEAEVTRVTTTKDRNSEKSESRITWKTVGYETSSVTVGQQLEVGQKMWVVVQDFDPAEGETDAYPTDEFGNELPEPESSDPESVPSQSYNSPPLDRA